MDAEDLERQKEFIRKKEEEDRKFYRANKQYISIDPNYRHIVAAQKRADQSSFVSEKIKNKFLSVYPYENSIWNAIVKYEFKIRTVTDYSKTYIINLLKNNENTLYHQLLTQELNKDFDYYLQKFEIKRKLVESYYTELKVIIK